MKRRLSRYLPYNGKCIHFKFDYWPATPDTRVDPGDPEEINLIEMLDVDRNPLPLPIEEDLDKVVEFLFQVLVEENEGD